MLSYQPYVIINIRTHQDQSYLKSKMQLLKSANGKISNTSFFPLLNHSSLPSVKAYYFIGNSYHQHLYTTSAHLHLGPQAQVFALDQSAIRLALEMSIRRKNMLTIISKSHYETIMISKRGKHFDNIGNHLEEQSSKSDLLGQNEDKTLDYSFISEEVSKRALQILTGYNFITKSSYLDVHPHDAYVKLCRYLGLKDSPLSQYFSKVKFTSEPIKNSFLLMPLLSQMREKFLITDQLKLQVLERKSGVKAIPQITKYALDEWKKIINLKMLKSATLSYDSSKFINWAIENHLGEVVPLDQILKGRFKHHHYAIWK